MHVVPAALSAEKLLLGQAVEAQRRGASVAFVCSPENERLARLGDMGFRTFPMDMPDKPRDALSIPRAIRELQCLIASWLPDVVHTHTFAGGVVGRLAAQAASGRRCVVIHTIHGLPFAPGDLWFRRVALLWIEKWLGRRTDLILTQSQHDLQLCTRSGVVDRRGGLPTAVGNGVQVSTVPFSESGPTGEPLRFVTLARVAPHKGLHRIVEALDALPFTDWKWDVYGRIDDRKYLHSLLSLLKEQGHHSRVDFKGHVDRASNLICEYDLFLFASSREGLPRSLMESQLAGTPVIAFSAPGVDEVVLSDDTTGSRCIKEQSPAAMASAILDHVAWVETIGHSDVRRRLRQRALAVFDEAVSAEAIVNATFAAISLTVADNAKP